MGWILFPIGVGWKDLGRTIHTGTFECRNPRCKGKKSSALQQFRIRQHRNWLVALYIPVLPLNRLGVTVQCASCKSYFSLDALPEDELLRLTTGVSSRSSAIGQADAATSLSEGASESSPPGALFTPRPCPHCQSHMARDASICPSCQRESTPWQFENGFWWTKGPEGRWYWLHEEAREWKPFEGEPAEHAALTTGDAEEPTERADVNDGATAETREPMPVGTPVGKREAGDVPDLRPLIENSIEALPAFVRIDDVTRPGVNEELDVRWSDMGWLEPSQGEEILGRWLCLRVMCHVFLGENDGLPAPRTSDSELLFRLIFDGGGPLFLTDTRLVGWIGHGTTPFGTPGQKDALLYTLPLNAIEELHVLRTKGWSGLKEKGVTLWLSDDGALFADLDRAVDESRRARSSSRVEAARAIVGAVAAIRRETATPEQEAILKRALAGDWDVGEDHDLEIALVPARGKPPGSAAADEVSAEDKPLESPLENAEAKTSRASSDLDRSDRPHDDVAWTCAACGVSNLEVHHVCTNCGTERVSAPAYAETEHRAEVETSTFQGCQECGCVQVPVAGDRFCRWCGHPVEAHTAVQSVPPEAAVAAAIPDASDDWRADDDVHEGSDTISGVPRETVAPAELEACWSCEGPVPPGSSECPHCGVAVTPPSDEPTRVEVPMDAGAVSGSSGNAHGEWLPSLPLKARSAWTGILFLAVTGLLVFGAVKMFSDDSPAQSFDSYTDFGQTTDYGVTDTDSYMTDPYTTTDSYTTTQADPYSTTPTATATLGAPVVERGFAIVSNDGYTGDLSVTVYDVFHASDFPPLPLTYRDTIASCDFDPMTDAIIPVSVQFQNTSPAGFSATPLTLSLGMDHDYTIRFAGDVRYSDGDDCKDPFAEGGSYVYSAHWATPTGAVSDDFYLVLDDYYSPSTPDGDEERLASLSLAATVGFGPSGSQSLAGADELIPLSRVSEAVSSGSTTSHPPPSPLASTTRRTTLALTQAMISPAQPYRCVSPYTRDHSGRMELELRYVSGATATWVSTDSSDTTDNFLFCGGSATHDLPGYASAPIVFQDTGSVSRIVSVNGILGADRDEGAPGRRVALVIHYDGERVCDIATDSGGHARRFVCRGFPSSSSLAGLELRLDVAGDRRLGVFAGIAELEAIVEEG